MKVIIDIDDDTIKWAGYSAIDQSISRKKFIENCIKKVKDENTQRTIEFVLPSTKPE